MEQKTERTGLGISCYCSEICGRKLTPWNEEKSHKASPGVAWLLKIYGPGWVGKVGYWSTVFRHDNTPSTRRKQSGPGKGRNQGMSDLWEVSAISLRVPYWY